MGIKPHIIDMTEFPEALQHVKELGYLQAPVIVPSFDKIIVDANGERVVHWSGFRPDYLDQLKP